MCWPLTPRLQESGCEAATNEFTISVPIRQRRRLRRRDGGTHRRREDEASKHGDGEKSAKYRKEERERLRAEQASRRKGRAERRRADGMSYMAGSILVKVSEAHHGDTDSDPSEELPLAARSVAQKAATNGISAAQAPESGTNVTRLLPVDVPPVSQPTPDTPPAAVPPPSSTKVDKKRSHKKKGRNQYTRDREEEASPARSQSRDIKDEHAAKHTEAVGKSHSKPKGGMGSRVTVSDMKRRAAALLNFITQTQMELAAENGRILTIPNRKNLLKQLRNQVKNPARKRRERAVKGKP